MLTWDFNHQTGILETKYMGNIYLQEVVDYIRSTKENKDHPRDLKIISDASQAIFVFTINDLEVIINENNASLEKYDSIIDALIVEDPKSTALSILYQRLERNNKYKFNVFSTNEAAEEWLDKY